MGDREVYLNNVWVNAAKNQREYDEVEAMKKRYQDCKRAETGATIICPTCKKRIIKRTYNKIFCKNDCKDKFWNNTSDKRRERAKDFNRK